jgi:hypothetical protein
MPLRPFSASPSLLLVAAGTLLLASLSRAGAGEPEVREFRSSIDGNRAGSYQMTITAADDGSITLSARASIDIRVLLIRYRYTYSGTELWKDGRLVRFDSTCNDDGKEFQVSAAPDADGLRVRVNGREHLTRTDAWVTTYWRLPAPKLRDQPLTLLDADTGRDLNGTLQYVGREQVNVGDQALTCGHYRVTGGAEVDLWYDGSERLVRQAWTEDGHRAVLQLVRVRR